MSKLFVLIGCVVVAALAAPVTKDEEALLGLEAASMKDCSEGVKAQFWNLMESSKGKELSCPSVVLEAGETDGRVRMDSVCPCMEVFLANVRNSYDMSFDCVVISSGVLNIRDTLKRCDLSENQIPEGANLGEPGPTDVATQEDPRQCIEGSTCFNGKCVEDSCVCENNNPDSPHPEFIGSQCETPFCEQDCNGNGYCDLSTGLCHCDSTHIGRACQLTHPATTVTLNVGPVFEDMSNSTKKNISRAICFAATERLPPPSERHPFTHVPQCTTDGWFQIIQCNPGVQECWCSVRDGREVPETRRSSDMPHTVEECEWAIRNFLSGTKPNYADGAIRGRPGDDDPCAHHFCGPNGYCDPNNLEAGCICIGKFTGSNCQIAPVDGDSSQPANSTATAVNSTQVVANSTENANTTAV